jgi:hypothetical protein
MLTSSDLIHLAYTPDLTQGGIAYAVRSLPYTYNRMGGTHFDRLRRIVAGVAVELAFRRYLFEQDIHFDVKGATPFTDPDRYDVSLGGHRCDLKSFLILHRERIAEMRRDPGVVLKAPALVPSDQHASQNHDENELYLFAFLEGHITTSRREIKNAIQAGQPAYLVHTLPEAWVQPQNWAPLGMLALKCESDRPIHVELAGQDEWRGFVTRWVELPPRTRVVIDEPFFTLSSIHVDESFAGRLGIHSPVRDKMHIITSRDWGNIWVYGLEILLAGYLSRQEFGRRAEFVQPGTRVFQYDKTRAKNLAVPVADLRPLRSLLEHVKEWEAEKQARPSTG